MGHPLRPIYTQADPAAEHGRHFTPHWNCHKNHSGFTFVELMVVVGIFTILLLFSIPLFRQIHLTSGAGAHASSLILFLEDLKLKSMAGNKNLTLHMDSGFKKIYVTDDTMDEEARLNAEHSAISLDGDLDLLNLEFPDDGSRADNDRSICFFGKGYSDRVLIHVREDRREMTIQVCMFQKKVHLINRYVSYDDCI